MKHYRALDMCSKCKEPRQLRTKSPYWCTECYKTYQQEYRKTYVVDREAKREANRRYNRSEKGKINKKNVKYTRRSRINTGKLTLKQWKDICNQYDHKCVACGKQTTLTIDHIMPLSLGGANTADNIQPLCMPCNNKKGATYVDYRSGGL